MDSQDLISDSRVDLGLISITNKLLTPPTDVGTLENGRRNASERE